MALLMLLLAILAEVTGTIALRLSEGFSRPAHAAVSVVGIATAYALLAQALRHGMSTGAAYGIWAALGVCLVTVIGVLFLGDRLTAVQGAGIALVVAGVTTIELGGVR